MIESPMKKKPLPFEDSNKYLGKRKPKTSSLTDAIYAGEPLSKTVLVEFECPRGYETLAQIALKACRRVWESKGIERHANNLPFDMQPIMTITRRQGHGFTRGQALKKIDEASVLGKEAALVEILEAITYLMADAIVLEEEINSGK